MLLVQSNSIHTEVDLLHLFTELFHKDFGSLIETNTAGSFSSPHAIFIIQFG